MNATVCGCSFLMMLKICRVSIWLSSRTASMELLAGSARSRMLEAACGPRAASSARWAKDIPPSAAGESVADQTAELVEDFFLKFEIHHIHRGHFSGHGFDLRVAQLLHQLGSQVGADD
jgi:hypothetical protein